MTRACLSCHTEAAKQVMATTHWTWETDAAAFREADVIGKKTQINNFCIGVPSNEPRCTSCHTGYGWADDTFDFTAEENVDCLVCHDTTGTYEKFPTGAGLTVSEPKEFPPGSGNVWEPLDLSNIALNIGATSRETCGSCHFNGGGGAGVKHGELNPDQLDPAFTLDVHMATEGLDFSCSDCHSGTDHQIHGSWVQMSPSVYDSGNDTLVVPHLFGGDEAAYWKGYDWDASIAAGLDYIGLPYGGEYGFMETTFNEAATHMVAPSDDAVECSSCHSRSSIITLGGFYLPGRDGGALDFVWWTLIVLGLVGIGIHAISRVAANRRNS